MRVLESEVRDGVWLVDLNRGRDAGDVARVVAQTIEPDGPAGRGIRSTMPSRAFTTPIHTWSSCSTTAARPRRGRTNGLGDPRGVAGVSVVATSRQVLGLSGEAQLRLSPLAVLGPDGQRLPELAAFDAVRLFAERASDVRPTFGLDGDNAGSVAEICRRLDGLPLAIELAAARANVFGPPSSSPS